MKVLTIFLLLFSTVLNLKSFAQDKITPKVDGFVRTDFVADSRRIKSSSLDLFSFYPMYKNLNSDGEDLNAIASSSMSSIVSRFGIELHTSSSIFGSKTTISRIETDFAGSPTYMLLRIRQAYSQLFWEHSSLLIGQTWHPISTIGQHPSVLSLNTGAPFEPFNRSPQIRFEKQLNSTKLMAAAIYQMMYSSYGPDENSPNTVVASPNYQRNALLPDLYFSVEQKFKNTTLGIGFDYKSIMPTRYVYDNQIVPQKHINRKILSTPAVLLYGAYKKNLLTIKAKGLYGQNLAEHSLLGGYAITLNNDYLPYNTVSSYLNILYGKTHQAGLLLGYTENLGPNNTLPLFSKYYGFGIEQANTTTERLVKNMYRFAPSYSYNYMNWNLGVEFEYTNAAWGHRAASGSIKFDERNANSRIYAIMVYNF